MGGERPEGRVERGGKGKVPASFPPVTVLPSRKPACFIALAIFCGGLAPMPQLTPPSTAFVTHVTPLVSRCICILCGQYHHSVHDQ